MPRPRLRDKQLLSIAMRIRAARQTKGLSQERVAELLDVTPETVRRWEAAQAAASLQVLRSLSRALSVDFAWLLGVDPPGLQRGEEELLQMWRRLEDQERIALKLLLRRVLRE